MWADRVPLHAALHCGAIVVRVLLLGLCAAHFSFPFSCVPVYAGPLMVGMGMMLLQLSSGVGTVRLGVRGVHRKRMCCCASGWNAGVHSRRNVNLSAHGAPVYDGSAWGTP